MQTLPDGPIIDGTVAYAGSLTGTIYVTVTNCANCNPVAGTSMPTPGDFAIRGDNSSSTTTVVSAFMDVLGTGQFNAAADPAGSATIDFEGSTISAGTITLADPTPQTPPQVSIQEVLTDANSALLFWNQATDSNGNALADHYKIYAALATSSTTCPASLGSAVEEVPANPQLPSLVTSLANGSPYCFAVSGVNAGTEGPLSAVSGPWTIQAPSGGHTVSGKVTFPSANGAALTVVVVESNSNRAYYQRITNPSSPQAYSIGGIPDGTYSVGAFLDVRGTGHLDATDPNSGLFNGEGPRLSVTADATADISIPDGSATAKVLTQTTSFGSGNDYQLFFELAGNLKVPVAASVLSGNNLASAIDLPLSDGAQLRGYFSLGNTAPTVGDAYGIHVRYSDGSSEDFSPQITGVVDGLATLTAPAANAQNQSVTPAFAWTLPSSLPSPYTETLSVYPFNGGQIWQTDLSAGTNSANYDFDGTADLSVLSPESTYQWQLQISDQFGNNSQVWQQFTTQPYVSQVNAIAGQVSYAGTATGRIYVEASSCSGCTGVGTSMASAGSFSIFGYTNTGSGYVTAFMDVLGTGAYNSAIDPSATINFTFTTGGVNVGTLTLQDPATQSPPQVTLQGVLPSDDSALVSFSASGTADHYEIFAAPAVSGACPTSLGTPAQTIPDEKNLPALVTGLTPGGSYCFAVAAVVQGTEGTLSSVVGPVTIQAPTGLNTVSGTVTFPSAPGAALTVVVVDDSTGSVYYTRIANPVSPQAYTITGVASGNYQVGAFLDVYGPGHIDSHDPSNGLFSGNGNQVAISGDLTEDITISGGNAVFTLLTGHVSYGSGSNYQLDVRVDSNFKIPVSASLISGNNLPGEVDFGLSGDGELRTFTSLSATPTVGDTYVVNVTYDDGSSESLAASVSGVVSGIATLTAPAANATGVSTSPSFAWTLPGTLPAPYQEYIELGPQNGGKWIWQDQLAGGTTSVTYNADGSASQSPLSSATGYNWGVEILDAYGNYSDVQQNFTTQ